MKISQKRFLIVLLVLASLIPNIGITIPTFGFHWTFYRVSVVFGILIYLQMPKNGNKIIKKSFINSWTILLAAWIFYGAVLMVLSPYRDLHKGFVELVSVFNGAACLYVLTRVIREKKDIELFINIIYWVYIALAIFGVLESLTGFHLQMSYFNDSNVTNIADKVRCATGIFYSENDFSSFLTCFVPILLYKKRSILGIFAILGTIYINFVNDANICMLAIIVSIMFYFVFIKKYGRNGQAAMPWIIAVLACATMILIWRNIDYLSSKSTLLYVIRTQQLNAEQSYGSLYTRIIIYCDSLKAALKTYFLGTGPASFTNYFVLHPSASRLVNPHNMYLEILVEYGLIIMLAFSFGIFKLITIIRIKILKCHDKNLRRTLIIGCEMLVLYSMVCISPSSFIGYAWQWIVISFGTLLAGIPEWKLTSRKSCSMRYMDRSKDLG